MEEQILFTICGRAGSKGVKSKNVRLFCGKPIVNYTLEIYKKYKQKYANKRAYLAVNTDSKILIEQIEKYGIECIFIDRKEELAGDVVSKADVILDTLIETEKKVGLSFDIIVDLDITSPLRNLSDVEGTIELVTNNQKCNFAYSVVESRRNPYFNIVCKNETGFYDRVIASNYTARQQVPACYDMNASIYVYSKEYLYDRRTVNRFALVWIMQDSLVLDIDSENDFEMMELLAKYYWGKNRYLDMLDGKRDIREECN